MKTIKIYLTVPVGVVKPYQEQENQQDVIVIHDLKADRIDGEYHIFESLEDEVFRVPIINIRYIYEIPKYS